MRQKQRLRVISVVLNIRLLNKQECLSLPCRGDDRLLCCISLWTWYMYYHCPETCCGFMTGGKAWCRALWIYALSCWVFEGCLLAGCLTSHSIRPFINAAYICPERGTAVNLSTRQSPNVHLRPCVCLYVCTCFSYESSSYCVRICMCLTEI